MSANTRARLGALGAHLHPPAAPSDAAPYTVYSVRAAAATQERPPPPPSATAAAPGALPITDIKVYTVGTRASGEQLMVGNGRALIMVKVEAEGGLHGWGESGLLGRELAVAGAVAHYRQFLIGR